MSIFRLSVKGGEPVPIDFKSFVMVTISKAWLEQRPSDNQVVNVTIKYKPMADPLAFGYQSGEKSEILASFQPGQTEFKIENMYSDSMNPKIVVPEGAVVYFEGNFTSPDEFADREDYEEESISYYEDEEDGDFQAEESD